MNEKNEKEKKIIDNKVEKKEDQEINEILLPRMIRLLFFILFMILTFLFNVEAIGLIDKEFKYKTFYLKMVSFFILCLFPITQYDKMKSIMMFLPSIVFFYFNVTFIELSSTFLSFLSFFTKIYSLAYLRIWIDQFAMIKYKTLFMYILNIIALTGDKISIVITESISFKHNQVKILVVQFLIFMVFFFTPDKYFFIHQQYYHYHKQINKNQNTNENSKNNKSENTKSENENEKDDIESVSIFINLEKEISKIKDEEEKEENEEKEEKKKIEKEENKYNYIFKIFYNFCYLWSILGKASIYFLTALLDYALIDYCGKIMNDEGKNDILKIYDFLISILSITGSIFGGIISIFFGGYENIKSCAIVAISSTITIIANFCLFYSDSYFKILGSICILFFFINVSMGDIEGYIIQSIPLKYKEFGLNFCGFISTLGYFLARIIYDYIKTTFEKTNEFFAWRFCLACFLFGYFSILLACTFRYKDLIKREKKKKRDIELEDMDNENEINNNNWNESSDDDDSFTDEKEIDFKALHFNSRKTFDSFNS